MKPTDEMVGAEVTEYTPESIKAVAEVLAPQATNYTNAITNQIGQAQQSMGPLAANTMGQSRTAGLGNYTYNRLVRPQVDAMRDEIIVEGYKNSLNKLLSDALSTAKSNYNKRTSGGGGGGNTGGDNDSKTWDGNINKEGIDSKKVEGRQNKSNYQLFWVVDPSGNRTQWKMTQGAFGIPAGFDNPDKSYELASGINRLKELVKKGYKVTDSNGKDITSRYK